MGSCGTCGTKEGGIPKGCKSHGTCGTSGCNKLTVFDWLSDIEAPNLNKYKLIEVRFKNDRKGIFLNINNLSLQIGDIVAVESSPGHDIGIISMKGALVEIQANKKKIKQDEIKNIYRIANQKDIDTWKDFREREYNCMINARSIARNLNLNMKICDVEFQGDGSKATFYYTAEGRVDFRELIKQYASLFRTKIDMRQIGYRQESAKVGGIGSCGRELCCSSWLTDFRSVNTAAARYQQLSINPQKLAGQCGKLKCCLNFELDSYLEAINDFPSQTTTLNTEKGKAHCLKIDVFRKKMWFVYSDNSVNWFAFDINDIRLFIEKNKKNETLPPLEELLKNEEILVSTDIIKENNLNRFENKNKKNKKKPVKKNTVTAENQKKVLEKVNPKIIKKTPENIVKKQSIKENNTKITSETVQKINNKKIDSINNSEKKKKIIYKNNKDNTNK